MTDLALLETPNRAPVRNTVLAGAIVLAVAGLATLAAGPGLYRAGVLNVQQATVGAETVGMWVFGAGLVFVVLGLAASFFARSHKGVILAVVAGIANGYGFGHLYGQGELRKDLPPMWDAQTDWTKPIAFSEKTTKEREAAKAVAVKDNATFPPSSADWFGMTFAVAQEKVYTEIPPLTVRGSLAEATKAAAQGAEQLGWQVTVNDPATGVVEAVSTSPWYGFVSDVAVRVAAQGEMSRVDIRSTSRIAAADMGSNAAQVKALSNEIALILR
jgi:uncharacterized protein (DUF1499 family)